MLYTNRYTQPFRASFGSLSNLVTENLASIANDSYHIAIVGPNRSGKTAIAKAISERIGYDYAVSDDFIANLAPDVHSYERKSPLHIQPRTRTNAKDAMYNMLDFVMEHKSPLVYVGSMVPRLLRAGFRDEMYVPDTVIVVECNKATLEYGHIQSNDQHKLQSNLNAHKGSLTILKEWNTMLNNNMLVPYPTIVRIDTSVL